MKNKKILAFVLIFVLMFSLSAPAFADGGRFASTKAFLKILNDYETITYSYEGKVEDSDGNNYDKVFVTYEADDYTVNTNVYFMDDNETALFRIDLIEFDAANLDKVLAKVNELNCSYYWVKFCADTEDNTVGLEMDVILRPEVAGEIAEDALLYVLKRIDTGYDALEQFAK